MTAARPPNVLLLLSDQHTARALGCYDNGEVRTPHLDRLAAQGTRFDAAYTARPVCVSGRFTLYTGRYVHTLQTIRYPVAGAGGRPAAGLPALSVRERTLGHHFQAAGYVTGFVGKFHPVAPHTHGFDYYVDFGHYADYLGPRYETFTRGMRAVDSGCGVPWIDVFQEGRGSPWRDAPLSPGLPEVFDDEADHQEAFAAREAIRFLRAYRDEPFCLVVSFLKPHAPWAPAPRYRAQYDPDRLSLPPEPAVPPGEDAALPAPIRALGRRFWQPHETWPLPRPGHPDRPAAQRRWLAAYYACVTQMDAAAGAVLAALDELGMAERTLVMYTSDHGEMAGEHGLYQKFVHYEGAARVPLIVRCPWQEAAGTCSPAPVDLADLVPTALDLCAIPMPDPGGSRALEGASLAPLLREPARHTAPGKGFAFSEITQMGAPTYMARAGPWKYVHYTGGGERQFFDLAADPHEMQNPAGTSGGAAAESALRGRLLDWLPAHFAR
ncbi:MAG: sulfatase-like hydrolase/transferase [Chloroflexi bacterium]|nr:sulfatase-like hydrolase/transferase [Chloroflexota bacterium]